MQFHRATLRLINRHQHTSGVHLIQSCLRQWAHVVEKLCTHTRKSSAENSTDDSLVDFKFGFVAGIRVKKCIELLAENVDIVDFRLVERFVKVRKAFTVFGCEKCELFVDQQKQVDDWDGGVVFGYLVDERSGDCFEEGFVVDADQRVVEVAVLFAFFEGIGEGRIFLAFLTTDYFIGHCGLSEVFWETHDSVGALE